jgi:hypothetical protein
VKIIIEKYMYVCMYGTGLSKRMLKIYDSERSDPALVKKE